MKKSIFITGSQGFIGKHLVAHLKSQYRLLTPTHAELDLTDSLAVEKFFQTKRIDVVIHGANVGGTVKQKDEPNIAEINLRMFASVIHNQHRFGKMIYFGSGAEYDKSRPIIKIKEAEFGTRVPPDAYGFYKYVCSLLSATSKKIINLRLFGVYGKYEDYDLRFISNAICNLILDVPITIRQNVFFDYLYINDLARIVSFFISHKPKYRDYNVGRGQGVDLVTLANMIIKVAEKKHPIKVLKRGLNNEYTCDVSRLHRELREFRYTSFEDSVRELVAYYREVKFHLSGSATRGEMLDL